MHAIEMRTMAKWFFSPNSLYQMKLFLSLSLSSYVVMLYISISFHDILNYSKYQEISRRSLITECINWVFIVNGFYSYIVVCTWKSRYRKSSLKYISRHYYISFFDFYSYPTLINFHTSWFNNWFTKVRKSFIQFHGKKG